MIDIFFETIFTRCSSYNEVQFGEYKNEGTGVMETDHMVAGVLFWIRV